jgi:site-specific recombinase XerD
MEQFFKSTETLLRLHEGPFGPYIESFARLLTDQGYAQRSVYSYLRLVADFTNWLEQQRVIVEEITAEHIKQYFKQPHRELSASCLDFYHIDS